MRSRLGLIDGTAEVRRAYARFSRVPAIAEVARIRAQTTAPSAIQPRQVVWLKVRATAYLMHDEIDKAVADLSVAIQASPLTTPNLAFEIRGLAYFRVVRRIEEAMTDYDQAIRLRPDDVPSYVDGGSASFLNGRSSTRR